MTPEVIITSRVACVLTILVVIIGLCLYRFPSLNASMFDPAPDRVVRCYFRDIFEDPDTDYCALCGKFLERDEVCENCFKEIGVRN